MPRLQPLGIENLDLHKSCDLPQQPHERRPIARRTAL